MRRARCRRSSRILVWIVKEAMTVEPTTQADFRQSGQRAAGGAFLEQHRAERFEKVQVAGVIDAQRRVVPEKSDAIACVMPSGPRERAASRSEQLPVEASASVCRSSCDPLPLARMR